MQLRGQVWLRQALPGPGLLRPRSHCNFLQRDGGGSARLHLEELQVTGVPGATTEAHQLQEHHHHLPKTCQKHLPHHPQLQCHRVPPLVRLHGAAGVQWGHKPLYHLHRGPVDLLVTVLDLFVEDYELWRLEFRGKYRKRHLESLFPVPWWKLWEAFCDSSPIVYLDSLLVQSL